MTLRISDNFQNQTRIRWISDNRSRAAELERNIATGRQLHQASDDPTAAARVMRHDLRLQRLGQYQRNVNNARQWVAVADQAVQALSRNLSRAKTLAVQAGNSVLDVEQRAAISADVRTLREEMLVIGNSEASGRPLFAGTADVTEVYDAAGNYLGDNGVIEHNIDAAEVIAIGEPGTNVFGVSNPGDPFNGSVFEMLDELATAIDANDTAAIRAGIEAVDVAINRVGAANGRIGARALQLDAAELRQGTEQETVLAHRTELRDTNVVEAIVELQSAQASYEASLSATARTLSRSLLDFLR